MLNLIKTTIDNGVNSKCENCSWYTLTESSNGNETICSHPVFYTEKGILITKLKKSMERCVTNPRHCSLMVNHQEYELKIKKLNDYISLMQAEFYEIDNILENSKHRNWKQVDSRKWICNYGEDVFEVIEVLYFSHLMEPEYIINKTKINLADYDQEYLEKEISKTHRSLYDFKKIYGDEWQKQLVQILIKKLPTSFNQEDIFKSKIDAQIFLKTNYDILAKNI